MTVRSNASGSIDLVVWSGTGNTRHVADRFAEAARSRGAAVRILTPESADGAQPGERTLLGILGPTHGFTATWPVLKTALTIPGVRGTDAFVLVTRGGTRVAGKILGGFEGTAGYLPAALLVLRGARVRGVAAVDMPLNWTVVVPSFDAPSVATIVARGDEQTDRVSRRLLDGTPTFEGLGSLVLGILILPLSLGYVLIARLLLAKMFFADERCISCGICEKNCPQGAVRLRGVARRPYWSYRCQNCMRCMSNCPTDAIQGGQSWLLFYMWLVSLPAGAWAAPVLLDAMGITGGVISGIVQLVISYIWIVAAVWGAYGLLWLGLFVPGVRIVLSRTTLTRHFRRYRGPDVR